jgi:uncharacterized protein (TIGR01777 family)
MDLLLTLLIVQALMGAFDTIYHHELTVALPAHASARNELKVHALRSVLYGAIFIGLAWFTFGGWWVAVLWVVVIIEVVLTLIDFLVEDHTRVLPQSERVLHTLLAIGGGAAFTMLALQTPAWWQLPTELAPADYGWKSWFLTLAACGVTLSGVRDALAAHKLSRITEGAPLELGAAHLKFLIAGGTGFIGAALTRRLIADGHEVTLVARNPLRAAMQFGGAARCVHAAAKLSPAEQFDVVVNLAGAPVVGVPWTRARKQVLLESRLAPTEDLLCHAERMQVRPRVWIQASATGYYGQTATNIDETVNANVSDFASELCHRWEARAQACTAIGIRYVALRFGLVMGRTGGSLPPLLMGLKLGAGAVIGSGRQFVSWIHIEDALGILAHAVRDAKLAGPINAVAPESVSYEEFINVAGAITHRPVWLRIPEQLLRKVLGEMAIMLVEGPCVLPGKLRTLHHEFRYRTLRSALTDLA